MVDVFCKCILSSKRGHERATRKREQAVRRTKRHGGSTAQPFEGAGAPRPLRHQLVKAQPLASGAGMRTAVLVHERRRAPDTAVTAAGVSLHSVCQRCAATSSRDTDAAARESLRGGHHIARGQSSWMAYTGASTAVLKRNSAWVRKNTGGPLKKCDTKYTQNMILFVTVY